MSTALEELIAPALEAYGKALDEHGHASALARFDSGELTLDEALALPPACRCGWTATRETIRAPRRAVGIHIAAARKRASKAYDVEVARLIEAAR